MEVTITLFGENAGPILHTTKTRSTLQFLTSAWGRTRFCQWPIDDLGEKAHASSSIRVPRLVVVGVAFVGPFDLTIAVYLDVLELYLEQHLAGRHGLKRCGGGNG